MCAPAQIILDVIAFGLYYLARLSVKVVLFFLYSSPNADIVL